MEGAPGPAQTLSTPTMDNATIINILMSFKCLHATFIVVVRYRRSPGIPMRANNTITSKIRNYISIRKLGIKPRSCLTTLLVVSGSQAAVKWVNAMVPWALQLSPIGCAL
jgi:hypothetical protein